MADDNGEDEEGPVVELGEGESVEGAPLARVAERFDWAQQKSEVARREGDTLIRTPDGAQTLADILEDVDESYFATQNEFIDAVQAVIGTGPVQNE